MNKLKYSQKEINEILTQILSEMKNYDPCNKVKPNVIFILKELYEALKIYNQLPTKIYKNSVEYLFGMEVRVSYNLCGKLFVLHDEIYQTFYERIKLCKSPEEMRDILVRYFPFNDKNQILNWLNLDFKYKM